MKLEVKKNVEWVSINLWLTKCELLINLGQFIINENNILLVNKDEIYP